MNMDRKFFSAVLLAVLLGLAPFQVMGDSIEETNGRGLVIRSDPSHAQVYIDGIERGYTPLTLGNLAKGDYGIRIRKEGYEDRRIRVKVKENSRLTVSLDLDKVMGQVWVEVKRSAGSPGEERLTLKPEISFEGITMTGPMLSLPVGFQTITVQAFGWESVSRTVYINRNFPQSLSVELKPAAFRLSGISVSRQRFNPDNSGSLGTTEFRFDVSAPGRGEIKIEDTNGDSVFSGRLGPFTDWSQSVKWGGETLWGSALPNGVYTVHISAESAPWDNSEPEIREASAQVIIDGSLDIFPLALSSGVSGLLFSPAPDVLPKGSFQIDGALLFGNPWVENNAGDTAAPKLNSLPFSAGFRTSILKNLELAGALNIIPKADGAADIAAAGSLKWALKDMTSSVPLSMAAALSYTWMEEGSVTPFGTGAGVQIAFPLSWQPLRLLSMTISPGILWTGDEGYPSDPVPRVLVSGGALFRQPYFTAGISARSEFLFNGTHPGPGLLLAGGELRLFPPPSSFVFTLSGGTWYKDGSWGGYGGAGIGFIY
jgi:hypothetical protein